MPVGGSVASSALGASAGARSRWVNVFADGIILVVILILSPVISLVAMPAMAALLILAGVGERVKEQLDITEITRDTLGEENIFLATENIRASTQQAWEAAPAWLERQQSSVDMIDEGTNE
jgi:MFS superfamily sulfate permease-like transporter